MFRQKAATEAIAEAARLCQVAVERQQITSQRPANLAFYEKLRDFQRVVTIYRPQIASSSKNAAVILFQDLANRIDLLRHILDSRRGAMDPGDYAAASPVVDDLRQLLVGSPDEETQASTITQWSEGEVAGLQKKLVTVDWAEHLADLAESLKSFISSITCVALYDEMDMGIVQCILYDLRVVGIKVFDPYSEPIPSRSHLSLISEITQADYVLALGSSAFREHHQSKNALLDRLPDKTLIRLKLDHTLSTYDAFPDGLNHVEGCLDLGTVDRYTGALVECLRQLCHTRLSEPLVSHAFARLGSEFPVAPSALPRVALPTTILDRLKERYREQGYMTGPLGEDFPIASAYVPTRLVLPERAGENYDELDLVSSKGLGEELLGRAKTVELPDLFAIVPNTGANCKIHIVAPAGYGKTTWLRRIAFLYGSLPPDQLETFLGPWAIEAAGIILVERKHLERCEKGVSLEQFLAQLWFDGVLDEDLTRWLQSPDLIFLLDEVDNERFGNPTSRLLFQQLVHKPRVIATSRVETRNSGAVTLKLQPLKTEDVRQFVANYAAHWIDQKKSPKETIQLRAMTDEIPAYLTQHPDFAALVRTPLYLAMLCATWSRVKRADREPSLTALYDTLFALLCRIRRASLGIKTGRSSNDKEVTQLTGIGALYQMAFNALCSSGDSRPLVILDQDNYTRLMDKIPADERDHAYDVLFGDDTFCKALPPKRDLWHQTYVLPNSSWTEYLAACYVADRLNKKDDLLHLLDEFELVQALEITPLFLEFVACKLDSEETQRAFIRSLDQVRKSFMDMSPYDLITGRDDSGTGLRIELFCIYYLGLMEGPWFKQERTARILGWVEALSTDARLDNSIAPLSRFPRFSALRACPDSVLRELGDRYLQHCEERSECVGPLVTAFCKAWKTIPKRLIGLIREQALSENEGEQDTVLRILTTMPIPKSLHKDLLHWCDTIALRATTEGMLHSRAPFYTLIAGYARPRIQKRFIHSMPDNPHRLYGFMLGLCAGPRRNICDPIMEAIRYLWRLVDHVAAIFFPDLLANSPSSCRGRDTLDLFDPQTCMTSMVLWPLLDHADELVVEAAATLVLALGLMKEGWMVGLIKIAVSGGTTDQARALTCLRHFMNRPSKYTFLQTCQRQVAAQLMSAQILPEEAVACWTRYGSRNHPFLVYFDAVTDDRYLPLDPHAGQGQAHSKNRSRVREEPDTWIERLTCHQSY